MSRSRVTATGLAVWFLLTAAWATRAPGQDWCGTTWAWTEAAAAVLARGEACPPCPPGTCNKGACDAAAIRDGWYPQSASFLQIRVVFVVFADDDGNNAAVDAATLDAQFASLNSHFAPYKIQFVRSVPSVQINDSRYRILDVSTYVGGQCIFLPEYVDMKNLYAQSPGTQLNIFVTDINDPCTHFAAWGSFPWGPPAPLSAQAGIVIDSAIVGDRHTDLAHEVGHNLGLWHTHNGSCRSELEAHGGCPPALEAVDCDITAVECGCLCYEQPGAADCDAKGDMCCDTPPSPRNYSCLPVGGQELCSGNDWNIQIQNFMSYSNAPGDTSCRDTFTPQQVGRMNCWTCDRLRPWIVGETDPGVCCLPEAGCISTGQSCCEHRGGTFLGVGTTCGATTGACCAGDGGCHVNTDVCCAGLGGAFLGTGTTCPTTAIAACCILSSGDCVDTTQACCEALVGGHRPNQLCSDPGFLCFWLPSAPSPGG